MHISMVSVEKMAGEYRKLTPLSIFVLCLRVSIIERLRGEDQVPIVACHASHGSCEREM